MKTKNDFTLLISLPVETKLIDDIFVRTEWQVIVGKGLEGEYVIDSPEFLNYKELKVGENIETNDLTIGNFCTALESVGVDVSGLLNESIEEIIACSGEVEGFVYDTTGIKLPKI